MEKEIIWSKSAKKQLQEIYSHILKKSKSNITSNKLIDSIYNSVTILRLHSEIYEVDEMKVLNDGNYRAYEIYSYRISYKITANSIEILRIRHTSRNPKKL